MEKRLDSLRDRVAEQDVPMIADAVNLGQSVSTTFPTIQAVPARMPSNPTVYAQPQAPTSVSG